MQNLGKILSSINDAVWSFDLTSNKFIYINNRLAELYQIPLDTIEESSSFWLKYVHPDDRLYVLTESAPAFTGRNVEIEYRLLIKDQIKWVCDKRVVLLDDAEKPIAITGILSDITSKKTSELRLSDAKKVFRYLFINNPNPLWIYDRKTLRFLAVNNATIARYGYSKDEFLSMTIGDIRPQEDLPELFEHVYNVKNAFSNPSRYWRHRKKDGKIIYVTISGHGINYNGYDAEMVMATDMTIEVESRNSIALAKENLDALINSIAEDIWSIDTEYRLISANNSYKKTVEEALGRKVTLGESVLMPEYHLYDASQWKKYYDKALKGESFSFTEFIKLPGKETFCAETKLNPIRSESKIIGVACTSANIQERIDAHNFVIEQNKKLRELISIASHEIRGPVATLLGLISVFNRDNPTDPFNLEVMHLMTDVTRNLDSVLYKLVDKSYSLRENRKSTHASPHNRSENE
ncbi:PAS domain-containing protein [Paradesertivirga mongoliensis]|uniref:histidine kinase n=1 Tax=Paradesertivirga mongoliensis TaxID=2100740 RepID=A0ABW4ZHC7_9SPHI|nr:PAS domain-containing protein [Pedobacter mongoliensis]